VLPLDSELAFKKTYFWKGLVVVGAYYRSKIYVSKLAGLIIGGKFELKFFECATGNIRVFG